MPKNYILCNDINGNPKDWGILNREKDCNLSSDDGNKIVDHLNQLYEDNKQYQLLVESLKKENQKLKLRLKDLGVEYY